MAFWGLPGTSKMQIFARMVRHLRTNSFNLYVYPCRLIFGGAYIRAEGRGGLYSACYIRNVYSAGGRIIYRDCVNGILPYLVKHEELLKRENRNIVDIVGKQGESLKKIKGSDEFFSHADLSWSKIYFKIGLHKFSCNNTVMKKSTLTSGYFKSNFKLIKEVCKANVDIFGEKK